jgi:hypothetical protein
MSKIVCPNCGCPTTIYSIPDWENGILQDPGYLECPDCGYNTGYQNTEEDIMAAVNSHIKISLSDDLLEEMVKTIAFYGDAENYHAISFLADPPCGEFGNDFSKTTIGMRPGKRARKVLLQIEKWLDETR